MFDITRGYNHGNTKGISCGIHIKIANNYHLGMTKITHPFLVMGMLIMILDIFVWI
jgi:hypothetical protein